MAKIILELEPMANKTIKFQKSKITIVPYITPEISMAISEVVCRNYFNHESYSGEEKHDKHYYGSLIDTFYFMNVITNCTNINTSVNMQYDLLVASGLVEIIKKEIYNYDEVLSLIKFRIEQMNNELLFKGVEDTANVVFGNFENKIERLLTELINSLPNIESINDTLNNGQNVIDKLKEDGKFDEVLGMALERVATQKAVKESKKEVVEAKTKKTTAKKTTKKESKEEIVEEEVKPKTTKKTTTKKTTTTKK